MKIKINILFWGTDKDRLANTNLSWYELKKFTTYARSKGLDIEPFLFDFSEVNVLNDAIHIPYSNTSYKRSEKINKVIDYHGEYDGFFSVMDSDIFIDEQDYDVLIYLLKNMKTNKFYVFKINDLITHKGINFLDNKIDYKVLEFNERQFEPDLGGLFFVESKCIIQNKFDEFYTVWSCEDNDLSYRLQKIGKIKLLLPIIPYHLPHTHALKDFDLPQRDKQVKRLFSNG